MSYYFDITEALTKNPENALPEKSTGGGALMAIMKLGEYFTLTGISTFSDLIEAQAMLQQTEDLTEAKKGYFIK